jgi:hypothetical protein
MTNEEELARSNAQLDLIARALKEYEIAKFLIDSQGKEAVGEALIRIKERDAATEDDDDSENDNSKLRIALQHRGSPTSPSSPIGNNAIKLGQNRSIILNSFLLRESPKWTTT